MIKTESNLGKEIDCENSISKLLLHSEKCKNIIDVALEKKTFDSSLPICIELHLTNRCNLNCEWCIDKDIRENGKEIPIDGLIRLLDDLQNKDVGITIEGGGEPTMHKDFNQFIMECYKRNIPIGLITNGTKRLEKELLKCFNFIRVSVDASTQEEYIIEKGRDCFNSVIENIRFIRMNNRDLVLGVSYALNKRNYKNIETLFNGFEGLGLNYIRMRNVEENKSLSLTQEMMEEVKRKIEFYSKKTSISTTFTSDINTNFTDNNKLPCVAHSLRAMVMATGDVYMCSKRRHDPIIVGNINEERFIDIWTSNSRKQASLKLLNEESQKGCSVCRMTKYNEIFLNLLKVKSRNFI